MALDSGDEMEIDSIFEKDGPSSMEKALTNPLILDKIFLHLYPPSVTTARLVCSQWNSIILSATPPLLSFKVDKTHDEDECYVPDYEVVNWDLVSPQLWRKVVLDFDSHSYTNLHRICQQNGATVVDATWDLWRCDNFSSIFFQVLENFPNLTKLRIRVSLTLRGTMMKTVAAAAASRRLNLSKLVELAVLDMWGRDLREERDSSFAEEITSILIQPVITSSPNLVRLHLRGNYYPDLSPCREKLVKLTWNGSPFVSTRGFGSPDVVENQSFNTKKLSNMLDNVSSSLQMLRLEVQDFTTLKYLDKNPSVSRYSWMSHRQIREFKMPTMPALKVFTNKAVRFFPLPPATLHSLGQLEILGLCESLERQRTYCCRPTDNTDMSFAELFLSPLATESFKSKKAFEKISKLKIDFITDSNTLQSLQLLFPNLQKFCFRLRLGDRGHKRDFRSLFEGLISAWDWIRKIPSVDMTLPSDTTMTDLLVAFMRRLETDDVAPLSRDGTRIKRLKIKVMDEEEPVDPRDDYFADLFAFVRGDKEWNPNEELEAEEIAEEHEFFLGGNELVYNLLDPTSATHKFFKSTKSMDQIVLQNIDLWCEYGEVIHEFIVDQDLPIVFR